jgi:hypothetical protein
MKRPAQFSPSTSGYFDSKFTNRGWPRRAMAMISAVELREGLIAVLGERLQEVLAAHRAQENCRWWRSQSPMNMSEQAGPQVGAGVDAVLGLSSSICVQTSSQS